MQYDIEELHPLIYSMEIRDSYTQGHAEHVAYYAHALATEMGLSKTDLRDAYIAGYLHDLGKIGIPDTVLLKPGRLEDDEYNLIKQHSVLSAEIVKKIKNYAYLQEIVKYHHEDFNGRGYPEGLQGEEIPLLSRIISVVDVFDALTTRRVYRADTPLDTTFEIMEQMLKVGKFDPEVYAPFISFIKQHGVYPRKIESSPVLAELDQKRNNFFYKDPLTQMLNRTALLALLQKIHDYKFDVSLVICDLKQFKSYNQLYGLRKGDEVLKKVAQIFQYHLEGIIDIKEPERQDTFLFHLNGDKFIVLNISTKEAFLRYKLKKVATEVREITTLEMKSIFLIKAHKIPRNYAEEIGYLL